LNLYIVVEGRNGARKVYKDWIRYVNNKLNNIDYLNDLKDNNYYIVAGWGQPEIFDRIEAAVKDVNQIAEFDRLVVALDSEDIDEHNKFIEVRDFIDKIGCKKQVKIVIQHFCLETWLLGNEKVFRKTPTDESLKRYYAKFDIRNLDPEILPRFEDWNRSQFAYEYLRAGMRDKRFERGTRISYTKTNPGSVLQRGYFDQVVNRFKKKEQINSFGNFLAAFSNSE